MPLKIDYFSDIHVNHWVTPMEDKNAWELKTREFVRRILRNKTGEVLVIAGDFSEFNLQSFWVLDECSKHYEIVYWTFGNHDMHLLSDEDRERYQHHSLNRIQELIEMTSHLENIIPLIQTIHEYKGVRFGGDVLWYLPRNSEEWEFYLNVANDSTYVLYKEAKSRAEVPILLQKSSRDWYENLEEKEKIDVMVTHVPPLHPSISSYAPHGCYHYNLPYFISKKWICGHSHLQGVFKTSGTTFYMNALSYPYEHARGVVNEIPEENVDDVLKLDIQTFEI